MSLLRTFARTKYMPVGSYRTRFATGVLIHSFLDRVAVLFMETVSDGGIKWAAPMREQLLQTPETQELVDSDFPDSYTVS
jgi:hypothetical protein